ncbi:DVU_1551 family NTP transferase [Sulfurospirillum multivorans]|uniref:Glycosyltransferase n=2 Tax=Sulfurospirillum multivorans TaxID=66821 RepID=A0AA86APP2_SULMK|nr:NTP transferase domain-containing protein [Sulfurospirillum multivorans]AHJ13348.1 glycosyltransferase [Sulfurospirillum multivorans DSM 12446]QEH06838.1 glycosyltransferase [Sulfurospirillum multivorans]
MTKSDMAVLIIAAGYSSRMHDFKPLLPFGETSALKRLIQTYQAHGLEHIYVVVGHRQDEIREVLKEENVTIVYNEEYDKGMFSSIQKGLRAMDEMIHAFYMQPVDIPLIKTQSLERLYEAYASTRKGVIYPTFLGHKGHPPLIDMKYKAQILASNGEGGLKKVLEAFHADALHVNVCEQSVLMDMDTKEDYENLLRYEALGAPNKEECLAMMLQNEVPPHIIKHCEAVEKMASNLHEQIVCFGIGIDKNALSAAAWVHDIARKEKNHALVGAQKLRSMGYGAIGEIVATHMDIEIDENVPLTANELLFLADKLVDEDEVCGFEKRFTRAFQKCEGNLEAQRNITQRLNATRMIIAKIEKLTCKVFPYG